MTHFAVSHYICPEGTTVPHFLELAKDHGAGAVGLTVRALEEVGVVRLRQMVKDAGLAVSSLNSAGYFTHEDVGAAAAQDRRNQELIAAAAELDAAVLCVIAGGKAPAAASLSEARSRVAEGLARLAERAEAAGVRLGLEPIHPAELMWKGCVNSIDDAMALVRSGIGVDLIVDLYHSWWDSGLPRLFDETPDRVALLQVCNVRERQPGAWDRDFLSNGEIDVREIVDQAIRKGYVGWVEFELFSHHLHGRSVAQAIGDAARTYRSWAIDGVAR